MINHYLRQVSRAGKGVVVLTSADDEEVSREDARWGGGHGVFTHYLLEGMTGKADRDPQDGVVTLGELFDYVRESVRKDTRDRQHPFISPDSYDRSLPMTVTTDASAQVHYELGRRIGELGALLDDRGRFLSAADAFGEAVRLWRLSDRGFPEASLLRGMALLAAGEVDHAIGPLTEALEGRGALPEALCHRGVAYARQGDHRRAAVDLRAFARRLPRDGRAGWARRYAELPSPCADTPC